MANVNYIVERESFMRHARDNGYTGNEQLFWYALFTIFNERASRNTFVWPDEFISVSNKELLSWLPFTENTLMQVRGDFVNPNKHDPVLVEYRKGRKNDTMPQYRMRWFSTHMPQCETVDDFYLNPRGNIGGKVGGNIGGKTGGNVRGNIGDITLNINQVQSVSQTTEKKTLYYNNAWRTDARARHAVAQNILDGLECKGVSGRANEDVCYYLEKGMTPEQIYGALDGIKDAQYISGWLNTAAANLGLEEATEYQ